MSSSGNHAPLNHCARIEALSREHRRGIERFRSRLSQYEAEGRLSGAQVSVVFDLVVRLGERNRNPANTGNIEDLFCHTLSETNDPIRAFAQALADSAKTVPMDQDAVLWPRMRTLDGSKVFRFVRDFQHLSPGDKMLVTHTMVAYGDDETRRCAARLIEATHPELSQERVRQEVAKMAVQSQHLPSSSFVLARATGLTLDLRDLYREAGYEEFEIDEAQRFYDICAEFNPQWAEDFIEGRVPSDAAWLAWRTRYLEARTRLPMELVYQLCSDTLTNFLDGTLESGKWTDASVFFGGVTEASQLPEALARIVNQYVSEHVGLHNRPASELTEACAKTLRPWGIGFEGDRAVVLPGEPEKSHQLQHQFDAAVARKTRLSHLTEGLPRD